MFKELFEDLDLNFSGGNLILCIETNIYHFYLGNLCPVETGLSGFK